MDNPNEGNSSLVDRPLECAACRKQIAVIYQEAGEDDGLTTYAMCADCPELLKHLHGTKSTHIVSSSLRQDITCGLCGTTMEEIRHGRLLGCPSCYSVFESLIVADLQQRGAFPRTISLLEPQSTFHCGKSLGHSVKESVSGRLAALNQALNETLEREDYEQAARLRDQIRAITDGNPLSPPKGE